METKYTCTGDASTISQYLFWLVKYCILKIIHFDPYSPKIYMTVLGLVLQSFLCLRALECNETIRSSQSEVVLLFRIFLRMVGEYGPWMKPRGQLRGNFTYQSQGNHVQMCTLTLVCTLRYPTLNIGFLIMLSRILPFSLFQISLRQFHESSGLGYLNGNKKEQFLCNKIIGRCHLKSHKFVYGK